MNNMPRHEILSILNGVKWQGWHTFGGSCNESPGDLALLMT